jgi:hypothetical protein
MADNLDLPQELIEELDRRLNDRQSSPPSAGRAEGEPSGDAPKPAELSPDVQKRLEYVDQLREREEAREREQQMDRILAAWDKLDEQDSLSTPAHTKLVYIAAAASSGQVFSTVDELAKAARDQAMEYRDTVLGGAVQRTGNREVSPALPGGPPAPAPAVKFKDLRDASKQAEADIVAGRLPLLGE